MVYVYIAIPGPAEVRSNKAKPDPKEKNQPSAPTQRQPGWSARQETVPVHQAA